MKQLLAAAVLVLSLACRAGAADWPTYRHDAQRSGASPHELPRELHLQWVKELPPLEPAWPDQPRLRFDVAYEPVAAAGLLFFGSSANDSVCALDAATGAERWRFYADGPVRFAPAFWQGRLFFGSDDGYLYCLEAATGRLLWRFRGGPSERLVLGNTRLVNLWVVRGAPAIHAGKVYFAAGIWPFEGVFVYCLDAETGQVAWANSALGAQFTVQPHASPAFAGVAPQGYLAVAGGRLLVPCGRSVPACLDLATGKFLYYHLAANQRTGGFMVAANQAAFANGGALYALARGGMIANVGPTPVVTEQVVYGFERGEVVAFDVSGLAKASEGAGGTLARRRLDKLWTLRAQGQVHIKAGSWLFLGAKGRIEAIEVPSGRAKPRMAWRSRITGTPGTLLAADGRLFVSTLEGHIYCFGATPTAAALPPGKDDVLVPFGARWRYLDGGHSPDAAWRSPGFDDRAWAIGPPEPPMEETPDGQPPPRPPRKRLASAYFRHAFRIPDGEADRLKAELRTEAARYTRLKLDVRAQDGAIVHLNGTEVWRRRAPGTLGYWTPASDHAPDGVTESVEITPTALRPGENVIAVELISTGTSRTPPSFELELAGARDGLAPGPARPVPPHDEFSAQAQAILDATGASEGYALVLGLRDGRLAEELARRSELHVVALDPDAGKVEAIRRHLDAAGLLARRIAVRQGGLAAIKLPPYFASLATTEDPNLPQVWNLREVWDCLRPYGGAACLPLSEAEHEALAGSAPEGAELSRTGALSVIRRPGPLPGAGDWTHQDADAANTRVSKDTRVRLPLGILWFGGSSHEKILPRHGHGPSQQVVEGRLFIQGPDNLRAMDIYTGRVLWDAALPGIGEAYDNTDHQPGANALGSNYVSAPDGIYVAYGKTCLRLDPATGRCLAEFALPQLAGNGLLPWGFLALQDEILVAGTSPADFESDPDFAPEEFAAITEKEFKELERWLAGLKDWSPRPREPKERDGEWLARNLNLLLAESALAARLPKSPSSKARTIAQAAAAHVARHTSGQAGRELRRLNRLLIEEHYPLVPRKGVLTGRFNVYAGTASQWLVALNRYSGKVLWTREARDGFLHNGIAIGGGKVFALDRVPEGVVRSWRWRDRAEAKPSFQLLALSLRTGDILWSATREVFGTWLAYSEEHDILVQAARPSRDMLPEPSGRMIAHRGQDGAVLWENPDRYGGPIMLHGATIITQGTALDLLTGKPRLRQHPLTGEEMPWTFSRMYGCGTAIASQHLLTFRSAAAGYYDLERDGGTGNLGGFRSGCTANLIAAGGLLTAPDYTRTCTCSYQNQTSLALVHNPETEVWTFNHLKRSDQPVRRVGINLGAPGDRLAPNGTLWLDFPSVGGPSPSVPVAIEPEDPEFFAHHSSWVNPASDTNSQDALAWVAASGATGLRSVAITVAGRLTKWRRDNPTLLSRWLALRKRPTLPPQHYTVRLHFVEPGGAQAGERVFDVSVQGCRVLEAFDVAAEAGGPRRPVVKVFTGIEVGNDLDVRLTPVPGARLPEPVLCGVELVGEESR